MPFFYFWREKGCAGTALITYICKNSSRRGEISAVFLFSARKSILVLTVEYNYTKQSSRRSTLWN